MQTKLFFLVKKLLFSFVVVSSIAAILFACKNSKKPPEKDVVNALDQLEIRKTENLKKFLEYAVEKKGSLNDSVVLSSFSLIQSFYKQNNYKVVWSNRDQWKPIADSLLQMVQHVKEYGLFPVDYHYSSIRAVNDIFNQDSVARRDAALLSRADILYTEAYFNLARHLKIGRLQRDSITARKDSLFSDAYFIQQLSIAATNNKIIQSLHDMEPPFMGYRLIRQNIKGFLDSADLRNYTYIYYPFKDSVLFAKSIRKRLGELGYLAKEELTGDSITIANAILNYQKDKNLKLTGKISETLVRSMNVTDLDRFKSIAATLDGYKMLPDTLPSSYILVNVPSFTLYVYDKDTLEFQSRVIVGSPKTRTPLLNSRVSNFITYPQWTVPYSIIFRDMLPRIKRNIAYLDKQNLMVVDKNDNVMDPNLVDWASLSQKHFPYLIRQRQGDDNSLGVIKFNFVNKYSVYLHDTNTRWLFSKSSRALSHGCVRVQDWVKLSNYLVRSDTLRYPTDTLKAWISRQEKHTVTGFPRVPLFIRYFTVEGKDGQLKFYNDIYGDDRLVKEKYFARKSIY